MFVSFQLDPEADMYLEERFESELIVKRFSWELFWKADGWRGWLYCRRWEVEWNMQSWHWQSDYKKQELEIGLNTRSKTALENSHRNMKHWEARESLPLDLAKQSGDEWAGDRDSITNIDKDLRPGDRRKPCPLQTHMHMHYMRGLNWPCLQFKMSCQQFCCNTVSGKNWKWGRCIEVSIIH